MLIFNYLTDFIYLFSLKLSTAPVVGNDPQQKHPSISAGKDSHLPLVLWHGMGDAYNSTSMQRVETTLREVIPDLYIHSIYIDENLANDQKAGILGDVTDQIQQVCKQLNEIPELSNGFNAIGFSQGGLFLRGALQMCGLPVKTLITYGSPHNGINDLPTCPDQGDWFCKRRNDLLKKQMYKPSIQNSIVQAQYFRDVAQYDEYIEKSNFLKYVNNEFIKDLTYYENFVHLEKLVLFAFLQDETLVPKYSAWFCDTDEEGSLIKFQDTESFQYDLIGLQKLYEDGKIDFLAIDDYHMSIEDANLKFVAAEYL